MIPWIEAAKRQVRTEAKCMQKGVTALNHLPGVTKREERANSSEASDLKSTVCHLREKGS